MLWSYLHLNYTSFSLYSWMLQGFHRYVPCWGQQLDILLCGPHMYLLFSLCSLWTIASLWWGTSQLFIHYFIWSLHYAKADLMEESSCVITPSWYTCQRQETESVIMDFSSTVQMLCINMHGKCQDKSNLFNISSLLSSLLVISFCRDALLRPLAIHVVHPFSEKL